MSQKIKILQIMPSLAQDSGVTRFVMNMARYVDMERFHFDYFHHSVFNGKLLFDESLDESLREIGSKVYTVTHAAMAPMRFIEEAKRVILKVGAQYDVAHCHVPNNAFVTLKTCAETGVGCRIMHSHLNSSSDKLSHQIRNAPLIALGKHYSTDYAACSNEAGKCLFKNDSFTVLRNGIPLDDFAFNESNRYAVRKELGIAQKSIVVGCVGRFSEQKNFSFALKVFDKFAQSCPSAKMVILGDGDDRSSLEILMKRLKLSDKVFLPGIRFDAQRFYSAFDVFLMPSLYEGLPISAVEAQASGLPCVFSTGVPKESDITRMGRFVSVDAPLSDWVFALKAAINSGRISEPEKCLAEAGYSAKMNAEKLMDFYERSLINSKH